MNINGSLIAILIYLSFSFDSYAFFGPFRSKPRTIKNFDKSYIYKFDKLPLEGKHKEPEYVWPGSYWPDFEGGIAKRWNTIKEEGFYYQLFSKKELLAMNFADISKLSPAEKYDILRGQYSYPTVKNIWKNNNENEAKWNGICHGVAVASLYHKEPKPVSLLNKDGIELRFYTSDIKALLAQFYAKYAKGKVRYIGNRCNRTSGESQFCRDMKANEFHILLTNQLGLKGESFIADIDRYKEVWNQAASSYQIEIIDSEDDHIHVKAIVTYAGNAQAYRSPVIGTDMAFYEERHYEYMLILDSEGNIEKGQWISSERPDFAWIKKQSSFTGKWKDLSLLLIAQ